MSDFDTSKGKQPLSILFAGYAAAAVILVLGFLVKPSGTSAWLPYLGFWVVSVLAYVVPFALFLLANGKVERNNASLVYSRKAVNAARFGLLAFGLSVSVFISFFLATEISKALNGG